MTSVARNLAPDLPELQPVTVPPCPVANDNAAEPDDLPAWDGDLPYRFDGFTQDIVTWSYARGGMEPVEVARVIGVSRQRVAEIEGIALRKLRKRHGAWLREFLEDRARR